MTDSEPEIESRAVTDGVPLPDTDSLAVELDELQLDGDSVTDMVSEAQLEALLEVRCDTEAGAERVPARASHAPALTARRTPPTPVAQHVFPGLDAVDCGARSGEATRRR